MNDVELDDPPPVSHTHSDVSGGWLRAAVFGAMDGLVTNISVIAGVGGAGASSNIIIVTGIASVVAGALSMALGEYTSVSTSNEQIAAEVAKERAELETNPRAEKAELRQMLEKQGLTPELAYQVAEQFSENIEVAVKVHIQAELGVNLHELPSAWTAAISSFFCFAVGGILPLFPYLVGLTMLWPALAVGAVGLFIAGASASRFTNRFWLTAGLRQLLFGAIAAALTYGIGDLMGVQLG